MSDWLFWAFIIVVPGSLIALIVVFLPFHLYNNAWRAFTQPQPVLSLFCARSYAGSDSRDGYYRLSGAAPKVYGVLCVLFGLSTQVFAIDFVYHFDPEGYATLSQKIELSIWLVTLVPMATACRWVPDASATSERYWTDDEHALFFWKGAWRAVVRRLRP